MPSIERIIAILEIAKEGLLQPTIEGEDRARIERVYRVNLDLAHDMKLDVKPYELFFKNYILYGKREGKR